MPDHHHALPARHMLAEYRIERVLGAGGFGITYYAWDTNLDKHVAIKEYMPGDFAVRGNAGMVHPKSSGDAANFRKFLKDFLQEARVLARFEHPHVNKVHRFFQANGTAYMVLEYIDGETLSAVLRRDGQLAPARLRRLLAELLSALEAVHAAGYVHRDVKPGNIMLRGDGSAVLLDFGIARQAIGEYSKSMTSLLTPIYAPIEQYERDAEKIGAWTDLYATGMVAYRCVSGLGEGELPDAVKRGNWKRRGEAGNLRPAVEAGAGKYDEGFLKAIDHAIEVYENERPQSVAEMREELGLDAVAQFSDEDRKRLGERFLGRDFSPTAKDENDWTDLHYAAVGGWVDVAQFLLDSGADVDAQLCGDGAKITESLANVLSMITNSNWSSWDRGAETPLHIAAGENVDKIAALLLKAGADVAAKANYGFTPLHQAAWQNADKVAALLLKAGADVAMKEDMNGFTPLHQAARQNADKVAALLLKAGADVAMQNKDGETPLHHAAFENADKVAELLLRKGANIAAKDGYGDNTPLHKAAQQNADKVAALLLAQDANIEAKNRFGMTPLHFAALHNAGMVVTLLLNAGANIAAKNADGNTPLHFAARRNADAVVVLLLKEGANIAAKDMDGNTSLHFAARLDADKTATVLLNEGAERDARNNAGETPLEVANSEGSTSVIRILEK